MIAILRVIRAFVLRGWISMLSYRFALWLKYAMLVFNLMIFFFIWEIFRDAEIGGSHLDEWGGNWFAYSITGGLAMTVLAASTGTIVSIISNGQVMGTLETILASPMSINVMLISAWCYNCIRAYISLGATLVLCIFMLDFDVKMMRFDVMSVAFLAMLVAFTPLGIFSAAFTLAFKRGDPVAMATGILFTLFGGVVFPPSVLPEWLQGGSKFVPIFYATNITRQSILKGAGFNDVSTDLIVLFTFGLILLPLSLLTFRWGLNKARRDGTLSQY